MSNAISVIRHSLTDVVITATLHGGIFSVTRVWVGSCARSEITGLNSGGFRDDPRLRDISTRIVAYLNGTGTDLPSIPMDTGEGTAFRAAVLHTACKIPYGVTLTYGELAANAGYPGAVRAAASVMRCNSLPLLIPCHRVVRKDGMPGGYCGSQYGEDVLLKERLLQMEQQQSPLPKPV